MTEKSHTRNRKKGGERASSYVNKPDDSSSHPTDMFNLTEMFKSINIPSDSQNYQAFEDQRLMSEIGKLFFTSMMKFSHILKSHNPTKDQNHRNTNTVNTQTNAVITNKNQTKSSKHNKYVEKNINKEDSGDKTLTTDTSLNEQYRKNNKNKKNKFNKQKFTENLNVTQHSDQSGKYINTQNYTNKLGIDREKLSKDKIFVGDKDKLLPTVRDNELVDYSTSTQCENMDVNFSDFQAPTPTNQNDEKQKLNLNIYRFINNCVSVNETSTTDTYIQTSDNDYYNFPSLHESNVPGVRNKYQSRTLDSNLNNKLERFSSSNPSSLQNSNSSNDIVPMTTDEDRLLIRCFGGDLDSVKKLKGCDLEFVDQVGRSAIHYACTSGNLELVKYLISNNVDIDKKDVKGWTPLFIAIVKNHVEIVKLLLDNGADLSQTLRHRCAPTRLTDAHSLPIHFAAIKSNRDITELLLRTNVDVNEKDSQGITPLSYSCYRGDFDYVAYLLENGANPSIQDVNGRTSYHSVALGGSLKVAKLLQEKSGVQNYQDRWSLTPSKLAQIKGFTQLSEFLAQSGSINSNPLDPNGISINSDSDDSDDMYLLLSTTIASALNESNSDQIYRCLIRLGPDVVKTLFELTLKVEKNGGVTTADGKRPRTPGGVFFTLLKQMHLNNYITKEDYQYIRAAEKERLKSVNHNHTNNKNVGHGNTNNNRGNNTNKNINKTNKQNNNENNKRNNTNNNKNNRFNNRNQNNKVYKQTKNVVETRNYD